MHLFKKIIIIEGLTITKIDDIPYVNTLLFEAII